MLDLSSITTPTLLLDAKRARRNLHTMAERARRQNVRFRPHFKTHQSAAIGEWFRNEDITAITVSSVRMGHYFADAGWQDITVAFPVNLRELDEIERLASRVRLGLLVDSPEVVGGLGARLRVPVDLWLEVDGGYHRSGVEADDVARVRAVAAAIRAVPHCTLRGLLTHAGNTYAVRDLAGLEAIHTRTMAAMTALRTLLAGEGWPQLEISVGDTPIASRVADLGPVDEIRPGNFIFYDWMQHSGGVCAEDEIAVAVACPVVAHYPRRNEMVIYGGAVHLSKECIARDDGSPDYGHVCTLTSEGWGTSRGGVWLRSLSQEHGVVRATPESYASLLAPIAAGELVAVLPIHSCLTADLLKTYLTLDNVRIQMMGLPA